LGLAYVRVAPFAVLLLVLNAALRDWFPGSILLAALSVVTGVALFLVRRRTVVPPSSYAAPDRAARQPSRSLTSGEEA
jgi:hypothetical protein